MRTILGLGAAATVKRACSRENGQMPAAELPPDGPADPAGRTEDGRVSGGPHIAGDAAGLPGEEVSELRHLAKHLMAARTAGLLVPVWRRRTPGEHRWPATLSVIAAIALQLLLSNRYNRPLPHYLLPALEGALLIGLAIANPVRIERRTELVQLASVALVLLITAANAISAVLLIHAIIKEPAATSQPLPLLTAGASIWATNVIAFALWYWEFDSGGPVRRAEGAAEHPDFMFPQMTEPQLAPHDWKPRFADYLYLSFTNATAFSPTDVMPLARWAKLTMLVQSAVSLAMGALVIARAVNILNVKG
jgi:uncharacterized membrane protein